jgi:hypothetical protein
VPKRHGVPLIYGEFLWVMFRCWRCRRRSSGRADRVALSGAAEAANRAAHSGRPMSAEERRLAVILCDRAFVR